MSDPTPAERAQAYREAHPNACRAHVTAYHERHRALIRAAKEGKPCSECGVEGLPVRLLHLHHVRGTKRFPVSQWFKRFPLKPGESKMDALKAEIAKCEVVCPTCHVVLHSSTTVTPL